MPYAVPAGNAMPSILPLSPAPVERFRPAALAICPDLSVRDDLALVLRAIREEGFTALELRGADWDDPEVRRHAADAGLSIIHVDELLPASLTHGVLRQSSRLRREFNHVAETAMATLAKNGIPSFGLNFDLVEVARNPDLESSLVELLRELAPKLLRYRLQLLLPVRIPPVTGMRPDLPPRLLRQAMLPQVLLAVALFPHECVALPDAPPVLLREYRYHQSLLRLEYEAGTGNQLTPKLLNPWLTTLVGRIRLSFRPRTASVDQCFAELANLHRLLPMLS